MSRQHTVLTEVGQYLTCIIFTAHTCLTFCQHQIYLGQVKSKIDFITKKAGIRISQRSSFSVDRTNQIPAQVIFVIQRIKFRIQIKGNLITIYKVIRVHHCILFAPQYLTASEQIWQDIHITIQFIRRQLTVAIRTHQLIVIQQINFRSTFRQQLISGTQGSKRLVIFPHQEIHLTHQSVTGRFVYPHPVVYTVFQIRAGFLHFGSDEIIHLFHGGTPVIHNRSISFRHQRNSQFCFGITLVIRQGKPLCQQEVHVSPTDACFRLQIELFLFAAGGTHHSVYNGIEHINLFIRLYPFRTFLVATVYFLFVLERIFY